MIVTGSRNHCLEFAEGEFVADDLCRVLFSPFPRRLLVLVLFAVAFTTAVCCNQAEVVGPGLQKHACARLEWEFWGPGWCNAMSTAHFRRQWALQIAPRLPLISYVSPCGLAMTCSSISPGRGAGKAHLLVETQCLGENWFLSSSQVPRYNPQTYLAICLILSYVYTS